MNKILIIVDPQNDFIENGSLPVSGGKQALDNLCGYLKEHGNEYEKIFVTMDSHPKEHMSFTNNGGTWPPHCVVGSNGAAVYFPLRKILNNSDFSKNVAYCYKGVDKNVEQYSVFSLDENNNITNSSGRVLYSEAKKVYSLNQIDICGLAGDVCVHDTLSDCKRIFRIQNFNVLVDCVASLDGGQKLNDYMANNNVKRLETVERESNEENN